MHGGAFSFLVVILWLHVYEEISLFTLLKGFKSQLMVMYNRQKEEDG